MKIRFALYGFLFLLAFPLFCRGTDDLQFIQNQGQFEKHVLFRAQLNSGYVYLEQNAITFKLFDDEEFAHAHQHIHKDTVNDHSIIHGHSFKYIFYGCNKTSSVDGKHPFPEKHNYFLGNDKQKWASNVSLFSEVIYNSIYPGINLKVYSKYGQIKYEWIVEPHADASVIQIVLEGLESTTLKNTSLLLHTSIGTFPDKDLKVWQNDNTLKKTEAKTISCNYKLVENRITYEFPDAYNPNLELIIDPILIFSTYSGSRGDNFGYTATFDARGNLYSGGITDNTHGEYPVTVGAFQTVCKGGYVYNGGLGESGRKPVNLPCDITISKYDSSGRNLLYATYVGGIDDEYPHSMIVNSAGELIVFGTTYSKDFPMKGNGYDNSHNSYTLADTFSDIIVFKLSKNGDQLTGSTFYGGSNHDGLTDAALRYNYADEFRGEVLTDKSDNVFVVTGTNSKDIPLKNAHKNSLEGVADGLCLKFSKDLDQLLWATYLGGDKSEGIYSLEFDKDENIYVAGGTSSSNLPTHSNAISKVPNGDLDGFLGKFNRLTFALEKLTYYGTMLYDQIYFLEIDNIGNVYATGQTEGNIPASQGVYSNLANSSQFIFIATPDLSSIVKQTVFGSRKNNPNFSPSAFLVDSCNNIYISGWGSNVGEGHRGSTRNLPLTSNAMQTTTDGSDFYLAVFGKNLSNLLYATFFGGDSSADHVDGGTSRFDKKGIIYQSVCSSCPREAGQTISDFPTSPNSAFPKNVSWRCSNAAFKIDFQINNLVEAKFIPDATLCGPADIQFTNQSIENGKGKYFWDFGDSKTSTDKNPKHSYPKIGKYTIQLIATDSNTCNVNDTAFRTVTVVQQSDAEFEIKRVECSNQIEITNKSHDFETTKWDFGDNTIIENQNPEFYEYQTAGKYTIRLIVDEKKLCPDTAEIELEIVGLPEDKMIPTNVFTPDGDGLNDCFRFDGGLNECSKFKLIIYNRWGLKVFETKDYNQCWNGCVNNGRKECPEGTYLYICEYEGESKKIDSRFSGTVTLIRE